MSLVSEMIILYQITAVTAAPYYSNIATDGTLFPCYFPVGI